MLSILSVAALVVFIALSFATALGADKQRTRRAPGNISYVIKDNEILYTGALCCVDSNGELVAGADTAAYDFAGVYYGDKIDNTDDGYSAIVDKRSEFQVAIGSAAAGDVGKNVYLLDDNTVGYYAASTNKVYVGRVSAYVSSTLIWVDPTQPEDLTLEVQTVADPAAATSTNGYLTSIASAVVQAVSAQAVASALASPSFSATVTSAEAAAYAAQVQKLASDVTSLVSVVTGNASVQALELAEAEKVSDDARAARTSAAAAITALKALKLFTS